VKNSSLFEDSTFYVELYFVPGGTLTNVLFRNRVSILRKIRFSRDFYPAWKAVFARKNDRFVFESVFNFNSGTLFLPCPTRLRYVSLKTSHPEL